jgi:hypothetical protein
MTVTWQFDDLKISHVDPYQITKFCQYLASIYGNGLVVQRGKVHKDFSMDLNFTLDRIVQASMIAYTTKVILDLSKSITTSCTSPTGDHLFTVQDALEVEFLLFTTLWHNSYSSANPHAGIFKPPSPS